MRIELINNDYVHIENGSNSMKISISYGPRIIWFGKSNGENILYFDQEGYERNGWRLYGGHRVWLTRPLADESEDTYHPDNSPCDLEISDKSLIIKTPANAHGIIRGMKVSLLENERFSVINFIENAGELLYSAGVWSPTCINPRGDMKFAISIGSDDTWDQIYITIPRKFAGNTCLIHDPQITYNEHFMLIKPNGTVNKRCVYSAKGKIAMTWPSQNLTFVKSVRPIRQGNYQSNGCNTAIFIGHDNFMVEMETYGEEQAVYPNERIEHEEIWGLYNKVVTFNDYKEIAEL